MEPYRGQYQLIESAFTAPAAWTEDAACRVDEIPDEQLDHFYAPDAEHEKPDAKDQREGEAKEICRTCPVRRECRAHALSTPELLGVWGGLGEQERAIILARNRGLLTYQQAYQLPDYQPGPLAYHLVEAVQLDATHRTIQECAAAAGITRETMRSRLRTAQATLGTVSRTETIERAARLGLIRLPAVPVVHTR